MNRTVLQDQAGHVQGSRVTDERYVRLPDNAMLDAFADVFDDE